MNNEIIIKKEIVLLNSYIDSFKYINKLILNNCNIISLISFESNITHLEICNNKFSYIPEDFFKNNNKIKYLELSNNNIYKIDVNTFSYLKEIKHINLDNNNIIDITNVFNNCENLEYLSLKHNKIGQIPIFNLNLKVLNFSDNKINYFEEGQFDNLINLKVLDFSYNYVEYLYDNTFYNNSNLLELYMNNNNIEIIHDNIFKSNTNLETLFLDNNMHIPLSVIYLKNLKNINITPLSICNPIIKKWYDKVILKNRACTEGIYNTEKLDSIKDILNMIIHNSINPNKKYVMESFSNDNIITTEVKNIIMKYIKNKSVHMGIGVSFSDIFYMSWLLFDDNSKQKLNKFIPNNSVYFDNFIFYYLFCIQ